LQLKVDHPHVVNPDPVLLEDAQTAGWPVHAWRQGMSLYQL
jgi:phosphoserine phosphatase